MKRNKSQREFDPDDARLLFGDASADAVLRDCLAADVRAAQLSAAFRAYYRVRSLMPIAVRQFLQRNRHIERAADWYIPHDCIRALTEYCSAADAAITTIHPWPSGHEMACVLTHDVETADGMQRVLEIAQIEEEFGLRSSWNIVPYKYPVDRGILRELAERGFEIGVHGFNHDGKLFTSRATFNRRVPGINAALKEFGAVGFRAPMVHRNLAWLQSLDIDYDASCFDIDPFQAMPGGVGGVWPFMAGRFVELPYTLPQDHILFIALGEETGRIWSKKLAYLSRLRGMALVITHPDYLDTPQMVDNYRRFLSEIREANDAWHVLPRDVATWWRQRDASTLWQSENGNWTVRGPVADRARAILVHAAGDQQNLQLEFTPISNSVVQTVRSHVQWQSQSSSAASMHAVQSG